MATPTPDPGWCGVPPFETGKWDPSWPNCNKHDKQFNEEKAGIPNDGFLDTTGKFIIGETETAAIGAYALVSAPLYILLATFVGGGLWLSHAVSRKIDDQK